MWEEQQEIVQARRQRLEKDLNSEASAWITSADQIDSRITDDLFSKEAGSTGYVTKYSNLWKYQVRTSVANVTAIIAYKLLSLLVNRCLHQSCSDYCRMTSKRSCKIAQQ